MSIDTNKIRQKIAKGDIKAYEVLFHSLYAPLCAYVHKIVHRKEIAEEIVQEIFYTLWKDRKQLNRIGSLKSYIYRSAYNRALHHINHQKVRERYQNHQLQQLSSDTSPEQGMIYQEFYEIYQNTLDELPAKCKMIFLMSRYEGLKYKEIAQKLSISIKTVEANIGKALHAFRDVFKTYHENNKEQIV